MKSEGRLANLRKRCRASDLGRIEAVPDLAIHACWNGETDGRARLEMDPLGVHHAICLLEAFESAFAGSSRAPSLRLICGEDLRSARAVTRDRGRRIDRRLTLNHGASGIAVGSATSGSLSDGRTRRVGSSLLAASARGFIAVTSDRLFAGLGRYQLIESVSNASPVGDAGVTVHAEQPTIESLHQACEDHECNDDDCDPSETFLDVHERFPFVVF